MAKLTAFVLPGHDIQIRPAPLQRAWMDATHQRYAYRCLPLNIANGHGWEILCPTGFTAVWDGGAARTSITVQPDGEADCPAVSHFGHGVLTFHVPCLFRTDQGLDMLVSGPLNQPKDAIAPLTGIVETDWAPYTFTMNWLFTRPGTSIRFEAGEPFCHLMPLTRGVLEQIDPEVRDLADAPELQAMFEEWAASRAQFNTDLAIQGTQAHKQRWQKLYFQGLAPNGAAPAADDHRSRVRLKSFRRAPRSLRK